MLKKMRWNCPHCQNSLKLTDNKIPEGWAFTRCAACSGFALVRNGAKNIIKVSSAPAGEEVLLPDLYTAQGNVTDPAKDIGTPETQTEVRMHAQADGSVVAMTVAVAVATPEVTPQPVIKTAQRRRVVATTREDYAREAQHLAQVAALTQKKAVEQEASTATFNEVAKTLSGKTVPFPMPLPEPPVQNENPSLLPVMVGLAAAIVAGGAFFHFL
jgi:hypothetical protein